MQGYLKKIRKSPSLQKKLAYFLSFSSKIKEQALESIKLFIFTITIFVYFAQKFKNWLWNIFRTFQRMLSFNATNSVLLLGTSFSRQPSMKIPWRLFWNGFFFFLSWEGWWFGDILQIIKQLKKKWRYCANFYSNNVST